MSLKKNHPWIYVISVLIIMGSGIFLFIQGHGLWEGTKIRIFPKATYPVTVAIANNVQSDFTNEEIEKRFKIINQYFDELNMGYKIKLKGDVIHFRQKEKVLDIGPAAHQLQKSYEDVFRDNSFVILLDDSEKLVPSNIHAQYRLLKKQGCHFIRGKEILLNDPLLFAHEFMHRIDLGHKTEHYTVSGDTIYNILSECYHMTNYTFEKDQISVSQGLEIIKEKSWTKTVNNNNIDGKTLFGCSEYVNLKPVENSFVMNDIFTLKGCGTCPDRSYSSMVKQEDVGISAQCMDRYEIYIDDAPQVKKKYSLVPEGALKNSAYLAILDEIFSNEYTYFFINDTTSISGFLSYPKKDSTLVTRKEFIRRKKEVLFSIIKSNFISHLLAKSANSYLICSVPENIYTDDDVLSDFLAFSVENNLLFENRLDVKIKDENGPVISDSLLFKYGEETLLHRRRDNTYSIEDLQGKDVTVWSNKHYPLTFNNLNEQQTIQLKLFENVVYFRVVSSISNVTEIITDVDFALYTNNTWLPTNIEYFNNQYRYNFNDIDSIRISKVGYETISYATNTITNNREFEIFKPETYKYTVKITYIGGESDEPLIVKTNSNSNIEFERNNGEIKFDYSQNQDEFTILKDGYNPVTQILYSPSINEVTLNKIPERLIDIELKIVHKDSPNVNLSGVTFVKTNGEAVNFEEQRNDYKLMDLKLGDKIKYQKRNYKTDTITIKENNPGTYYMEKLNNF